jgi:signal transduction histidine kinase
MARVKETFPLDGAKWPVIVIKNDGKVLLCNEAAKQQLHNGAKGIGHLNVIWTDENGCSSDDFVKRISTTSISAYPLRLKTRTDEELKHFTAHICIWPENTEKRFLLQLFPRKLPQTGTTQFLTRDDSGDVQHKPLEADPPVAPPADATPASAPVGEKPAPMLAPPTEPNLTTTEQHKLMCALQLTRTVAMDFNNALTGILGHTSLLLNKISDDDPSLNSLEQIERAVERAAQVAFDLAAFSRDEKEMFPATSASLNKLVRRMVEQYRGRSQTITWRTSLDSKLFSSTFAEPKMQQAIEKVFDNAIEALGDEGSISLTTQNKSFDEEYIDGFSKISAGKYVCLEVNDSGPGIPPDKLSKVMDPFFTTKDGHRGLGLAWAYGLITNFSGHLVVSSEAGQGTTARLYLPALQETVDELVDSEDALRGDQTILIVDDEELLLTMGEMVLGTFGYNVLTAGNGRQALDVIEENGAADIDLVVTDLVMPHMDGYALIENLKSQKPDLKIICTSGNFRPSNRELGITYLQKPFDSMDLARAVKKVLTE